MSGRAKPIRAHPRRRGPVAFQEGAPQPESSEAERLVAREWLVTNGLGGYASGTVSGVITRRYHGLLIAALPAPIGRAVLLNQLSENVRLPDSTAHHLGGEERTGSVLQVHGARHLAEFRLEQGLPVWTYDIDGAVIEKRVLMPHGQNTTHISYRLLQGQGPLRLKLRPALHFRLHEQPVTAPVDRHYRLVAEGERLEIHGPADFPPLRLLLHGRRNAFTLEPRHLVELLFRVEASRGYESAGELWCPGFFRADLDVDAPVVLVASTEPWDVVTGLTPVQAYDAEIRRRTRLLELVPSAAENTITSELLLAADQFIVTPATRLHEAARAEAGGEAARTIIAGYHWFTDWGRDTMISLEGLTLCTGRHREAAAILRTFARHVKDGLIPNMFPDGATAGLYHTADATLWFFHALDRYLAHTSDWTLAADLLATMQSIVQHHIDGTRFGIRVDPADGLLSAGEEGYQLTWMDAKCDGWVVTPRRGKPVEINALWYNALRALEGWLSHFDQPRRATEVGALAQRARASFNARFWYEQGGHLFDVIDGPNGDDHACRPNQVFAIALPHPVLEERHWESVMATVERKLLTPVGLRSLAPDHPDYHGTYHGDLRTRDAAYHQGTVWAWLIGPFIDAWYKVHPERPGDARRFLQGLVDHLDEFGVGTIAEIFDAEPPFTARGCIAQAWSVAEVLRAWTRVSSAATSFSDEHDGR